ncbi:MBL fold metallo-hydrolase [Salarchaeum japonicum]|uniref:MBL fold metallo-hydrolase n=1 Tax=Salarchaeum japonicum TaxID=555573 RepID=A0AAV3T2N0_9EURY|nr:MBL fold metallo-hydrolase [Salarchaeum japonicum]
MRHIQLGNTEFEGRNSVYLLAGDGPTTLVDTGVGTDGVYDELAGALSDAGHAVGDLDRILLTHFHEDHAGLAGRLQRESGADVVVHEADAPLVAGDEEARAAMHDRQRDLLDEWGMPAEKQRELLDFLDTHDDIRGEPADVTPVADGDTLALGPYEAEVVHLPGHAAGLVGYLVEREGRREAFVGDALLPKYTPNVGGADVRVERPLRTYLDSLDRIESLGLDRAWPGHRGPIFAPTLRARDIADHHAERTERVLSVLRERGPATPWEVSADLFGDLHAIHVLHGPGEAYAHLDHLESEGVVSRTGREYALVADADAADLRLD